MVDRARNASRRLGDRGVVLLLLGIGYIGIGINFGLNQDDPSLLMGYAFVAQFAPLSFWGGVFITVGLVGVTTAFLRTGQDSWGFSMLSALTAAWAFGALGTFFTTGLDRAIVTFIIWGLLGVIIAKVAGMRGRDDD